VTQMRNIALKYDITFKTSFFAKTKTAIQMLVSGLILVFLFISFDLYTKQGGIGMNYLEFWHHPVLYNLPKYLVIFTAILTGATGIDYLLTLLKEIRIKHN
ncbi:MAG: hypothetical protein ACRCV0_06455, partial [Brevinema sp.]